jgi:hypothetical protein
MQTPTNESLDKRHADSFETGDAGGEDSDASSVTKEMKLPCVKLENTK